MDMYNLAYRDIEKAKHKEVIRSLCVILGCFILLTILYILVNNLNI